MTKEPNEPDLKTESVPPNLKQSCIDAKDPNRTPPRTDKDEPKSEDPEIEELEARAVRATDNDDPVMPPETDREEAIDASDEVRESVIRAVVEMEESNTALVAETEPLIVQPAVETLPE